MICCFNSGIQFIFIIFSIKILERDKFVNPPLQNYKYNYILGMDEMGNFVRLKEIFHLVF